EPPPPKLPSDIDLGVNVLDRTHRLIEAIDQSAVKRDPDDDNRFMQPMRWVRHIDFPAVVAALNGLTADQLNGVEAEYLAFEHRPVQYDLFGGGESNAASDLTVDQRYQLRALLKGTVASSEEDAEAAAKHHLEGDAAELHALLYGELTAAEIE